MTKRKVVLEEQGVGRVTGNGFIVPREPTPTRRTESKRMGQRAEGPTEEPQVFPEGVRPQRVMSTRWSVLLAFVVTMLTCMLSGALKSMADEIAAIWLANAVLLGQMMVVAPRQRYWVLAGGIAGNLAANLIGESLAVSLSYTLADTLEVLIAFSFAPRLSAVADLLRPKALLRFLAGGVILAPLLSGLLATALLRSQLSGHLLPNLANWFVSRRAQSRDLYARGGRVLERRGRRSPACGPASENLGPVAARVRRHRRGIFPKPVPAALLGAAAHRAAGVSSGRLQGSWWAYCCVLPLRCRSPCAALDRCGYFRMRTWKPASSRCNCSCLPR